MNDAILKFRRYEDDFEKKSQKPWRLLQKYLFLHCEKFVTKSS